MINREFKVTSVTKYYGDGNEDYWTTESDGRYRCDKIEYYQPMHDGGSYFVDVYFGDNFIRLFNPSKIEFEKVKEVK